jgi:ribosomal protein L11 methylase PrmA
VARKVVAENAVAARVEVQEGGPERLEPGGYDGIVANISAGFFLDGAAPLGQALRPGGVVLACGFLRDESGTVARALAGAGLETMAPTEHEGWCALVARRPAPCGPRGT